MEETPKHCSLHYFLYGLQICVICIATSLCIFKLFTSETDSKIWASILSSCIGYILPNPTPKCKCASVSNENQAPVQNENLV